MMTTEKNKTTTTNYGELTAHVASELMSPNPEPQKIKNDLRYKFNLTVNEANELLYSIVLKINKQLFPPITTMEIFHTDGCNLRCSYCFEQKMLACKNMSQAKAKAAVDLLFDYCGNEKELRILHFGGEPMLNFDSIIYVSQYAKERADKAGKIVSFDMTTNGTLLSEERAILLANNNIKTLISLDGMQESHDRYRVDQHGNGSFLQVIEGLKRLKVYQAWMGVKMTIHPENVNKLFKDVIALHGLGVNHFVIGHATGVAWTEEGINTFEDQLNKIYNWYVDQPRSELRIQEFEKEMPKNFFGCQAGRHSITVTVDGAIAPCAKMVGLDKSQLIYRLGDILNGVYQIANRRELVGCGRLKANCENMGIANEYHGGCFATNYEGNADIFMPNQDDQRFQDILKRLLQRNN